MAIVLYTIAYIGDVVNTISLSERAREPADFDMLILLICFVDYRHKLLLCEGLSGEIGLFASRFYLFNSEFAFRDLFSCNVYPLAQIW